MRLRFHIVTTCILGIVLSHLAASFDVRRRREVPDSPESYKYYVRPFVVPQPERALQADPLLKAAQSVSESTSAYKPPLLALPSSRQPTGPGGYQPPIALLSSVPQPQGTSGHSAPLERKPLLYSAADITELSQSPPERRADAIDKQSKAVGSSRHSSQAIHQVPASEIQSDKSSLAKDRDSAKSNDEYVVYYYYYYDNDTNSNNLTLNFDDIPSLDSYDEAKSGKEPAKSASSRSIAANVNALTPSAPDQAKDNSQRVPTRAPQTAKASAGASQPRSLSSSDSTAIEPVIRADKPDNSLEDTIVQPLKPVSNVFRYGSNEVPRFPVLPNFIVSEVPKEVKPEEQSTHDTLSTPPSPTIPTSTISGNPADERLQPEVDGDDANNALDSDNKVPEEQEDKVALESSTTTTTTTTTEPPTTTEIQTTTTEKTRRRPGLPVGGRRRVSSSAGTPPPPRSRQTPTRASSSSSSSSTTSTTTSAPSSSSTTRSFRGSSNRLRPRQPIGGNRPRPSLSSTKSEENEESGSSKQAESTSTTATSRSRLSTTAAPRRFAGGRNSAARSSTSTTASSRLRTTSRPRPNIIPRNRPRPGFLRPRPGKEEEPVTVETTTPEPEVTEEKISNSASTVEETEPEEEEESEGTDTEAPEADEEETEEPTTTEKNRFAALFRPRNRSGNGNRPRPVIANRPSRSRR